MKENWKPYLCRVNDKLASVLIDLALRGVAPVLSKPWLLWTWVYFQSPRPDGLSDGGEAPRLFEIEDALTPRISSSCGAILSGRITTQGRREFYYYGETGEGFEEAVSAALAGFKGYRYDLGQQRDEAWDQYLTVLYPSPEDLQRILNRDLLDVLVGKGDILTVPREVRHWIYFSSDAARALCLQEAAKAGFKISSPELPAKGDLPFGASVSRTQSVEQNVIDTTVIELLQLTQRFDGEYDGWETPIVTR
jgi:regulator of RNase E activity RraB